MHYYVKITNHAARTEYVSAPFQGRGAKQAALAFLDHEARLAWDMTDAVTIEMGGIRDGTGFPIYILKTR